jgi:L-seryl-tRNA(Ser) seleniumtransferase
MLLTRPLAEIRSLAERLLPQVSARFDRVATVSVTECLSQIGSGALPTRTIPSAGLSMRPSTRRGAGATLHAIAASFRALPVPVIGRIQDDAFILDLRCLTDEHMFAAQLTQLRYQDVTEKE